MSIFTFPCLCMDNFLSQIVSLPKIILPATFYNPSLPFQCIFHVLVICHMQFTYMSYGGLNYELFSLLHEGLAYYSY